MDDHILLNVALMTGVTLVAIIILGWGLKFIRRVSLPISNNVEVIGGANLGGKSKLYLLKVDGQQILIGATESNINTLYVYDSPKHNEVT